MSRRRTVSTLADLAEEQWGLVTTEQARAAEVAWSTVSRLAEQDVLQRVARGVYRVRGAPPVEHLELRASLLQLAPRLPAWQRGAEHGVVSHRSAAALYGLGHLPADRHEFIVSRRRQTRRADVRLHHRRLDRSEWVTVDGLPVTRPQRIATDLLADGEDPAAVGHIIADALRAALDEPAQVALALAPRAARLGLPGRNGLAALGHLLELTADPRRSAWLAEALT
jgi:predicted transcriptional regulator of viral defense system